MKRKLRVLACNFSPIFGGQERYLSTLAAGLMGRDVAEVDLLGGPAELSSEKSFQRTFSSFEEAFREQEYDWIILNGNRALYRATLSGGRKSSRTLYIQHSSFFDRQAGLWKSLARRVLIPFGLRKVDRIVRVCRAVLPLDEQFPNMITIAPGVAKPAAVGTTHDWNSKQLLMVGALTPNKRQDLAIRALTTLSGFHLTLVGDGPMRAELEALASSVGVGSRVRFAGTVRDPSAYYRDHGFFLSLSQSEGIPLAMLEAMSHGCCIVATAVGGIPEVIEQDRDGVLLSSDVSHTELAGCLTKLTRDPEVPAKIGERAREKTERMFSAEQMIDRFQRILFDE